MKTISGKEIGDATAIASVYAMDKKNVRNAIGESIDGDDSTKALAVDIAGAAFSGPGDVAMVMLSISNAAARGVYEGIQNQAPEELEGKSSAEVINGLEADIFKAYAMIFAEQQESGRVFSNGDFFVEKDGGCDAE